ncbi:Alpha/Beta hydrolase protein [Dichotomocladium elegans]|nr:Alpha/Beta hydrolase protein [Dichotomocladium elegans]
MSSYPLPLDRNRSTSLSTLSIPTKPSSTSSSFVAVPNLSPFGSGITWLTGAALLYLYQSDLIYPSSFPEGSRDFVARPSDYGVEHSTEEWLTTRDHIRLHIYTMLVSNDPAEARNAFTILYFHANAGNMGHRLPIAKVFHDRLRCNVVMLSYRGYGLSTGKPSEKGLRIDAQTLLDHVRSHPILKDTRLVAYGQSIGGAVAIDLVARNDGAFAGLIVENTFLSVPKLIPHVVPVLRHFSFLCHQHWSSETRVRRIYKTPVLFLSGTCDELVPPPHMRKLHDQCASSHSKDWVQFPNGMHNDTCMQPGYFTAIGEFLETRTLSQKTVRRQLQERQEKQRALDENTYSKRKKYGLQGRRKSTNW